MNKSFKMSAIALFSLTVLFGCKEDPKADFIILESVVAPEENTVFINNSEFADQYEWDFGDGTTSTGENATHAFDETGTYIVELKAIRGNKNDSKSLTVEVEGSVKEVVANFAVLGTKEVSVGDAITFINSSSNGVTFEWDFGDGNKSTAINATHTYTTAGIFSVKLTASADGNTSDYIESITVIDITSQFTGSYTGTHNFFSGLTCFGFDQGYTTTIEQTAVADKVVIRNLFNNFDRVVATVVGDDLKVDRELNVTGNDNEVYNILGGTIVLEGSDFEVEIDDTPGVSNCGKVTYTGTLQ